MGYKAINCPVPSVRAIGDYWSQQFASMMNQWFGIHKFDKAPSPVIDLPNGERIILADVMLFERQGENYYCEVKHKNPTKWNTYGLEQYRFESLAKLTRWAKGVVLYVIHDYTIPGRENQRNYLSDWYCVEITKLERVTKFTSWGPSLVAGVTKRVPIHYWGIENWERLSVYFDIGGIHQ